MGNGVQKSRSECQVCSLLLRIHCVKFLSEDRVRKYTDADTHIYIYIYLSVFLCHRFIIYLPVSLSFMYVCIYHVSMRSYLYLQLQNTTTGFILALPLSAFVSPTRRHLAPVTLYVYLFVPSQTIQKVTLALLIHTIVKIKPINQTSIFVYSFVFSLN